MVDNIKAGAANQHLHRWVGIMKLVRLRAEAWRDLGSPPLYAEQDSPYNIAHQSTHLNFLGGHAVYTDRHHAKFDKVSFPSPLCHSPFSMHTGPGDADVQPAPAE